MNQSRFGEKKGPKIVSARDAKWLDSFSRRKPGSRNAADLIRAIGLETLNLQTLPARGPEGSRTFSSCKADALAMVQELIGVVDAHKDWDSLRFGPASTRSQSLVLRWASEMWPQKMDCWVKRGRAPLELWSKFNDFNEEAHYGRAPGWEGLAKVAFVLTKNPLSGLSDWDNRYQGDAASFKKRVRACASFAKSHAEGEAVRLAVADAAGQIAAEMFVPRGPRSTLTALEGAFFVAGEFLGQAEASALLGAGMARAAELGEKKKLLDPWLSPLRNALMSDHLPVVKVLADEGRKIDPFLLGGDPQEQSESLLQLAIHSGAASCIQWLIGQGAELRFELGDGGRLVGWNSPMSTLRTEALAGSAEAEAALMAIGKAWVAEIVADGLPVAKARGIVQEALRRGVSTRSAKGKSSFERLIFTLAVSLNEGVEGAPAKKAAPRL